MCKKKKKVKDYRERKRERRVVGELEDGEQKGYK